jgi:hypothetical protein
LKKSEIVDRMKILPTVVDYTGIIFSLEDSMPKRQFKKCAEEAKKQLEEEFRAKYPGEFLPNEDTIKKAGYALILRQLERRIREEKFAR